MINTARDSHMVTENIPVKVSLYTDPKWLCEKLYWHEKQHSFWTIMIRAHTVGACLKSHKFYILSLTKHYTEMAVPETRSFRAPSGE